MTKVIDVGLPRPSAFVRKTASGVLCPEFMTPELAELLGYFEGDGAFGTYQVWFYIKDLEREDLYFRITDSMVLVFGLHPSCEQRREPWGCGVVYARRQLTKMFRLYGCKTEGVVDLMKQASSLSKAGFIRGLLSADGSQTKRDGLIRLTSSKLWLAEGVQDMLGSLGIGSRIAPHTDEGTLVFGRYTTKASVYLAVDGGSRLRFLERVGFMVKAKQEAYNVAV